MSNQPKEFIWDSCLDESSTTKAKPTRMVNKEYMHNLPIVHRNIEAKNLADAKAAIKLSKTIIR